VPTEPLALLLLRASRWFDSQLLERLEQQGWPRLSPAQSLVFAHLTPDGVPPATLARRLGTSRQATQDLVAGLVGHGLLEPVDDPARPRGRLIVLTATGRDLARDAGAILAELEHSIGAARARAMRDLLAGMDGCQPTSPEPGRPALSRPSPGAPAAGATSASTGS
jgi:DNA-binding MarR family transcriptional regulator